MGQTKKERAKRKFRYNVNRRRQNQKQKNTGNAAVGVPLIKNAWEESKSIRENLVDMGLAFDSNITLKIPTAKDSLIPLMTDKPRPKAKTCPSKAHIAEALEAEAKAPREKRFALPLGQVQFLTYLLNKYGDDYEAMARDNKNIYQETPRQIRNKIRTFQKIPSQWNAYLASRSESENPGPVSENHINK